MICKPCRYRDHVACPETARQLDAGLSAYVKAGSSLCDCRHAAATAGESETAKGEPGALPG